jgi:hypothetical protein
LSGFFAISGIWDESRPEKRVNGPRYIGRDGAEVCTVS